MHIVILSRNSNLYSTKRLLKEDSIHRDHRTEVVDHLNCNIVIEKKNPRVFYKD